MSSLHVKYLLVGGGLASSSAARAIRQRDPDGSVLLVGQEIHTPYRRAPLSKEFLGRRDREHASLSEPAVGWFDKHHVELRTGRRAAHLDTTRHTVTLDDGSEVSYDRLLIATGSSPKHLNVPGAELPGLFYLRTIEDAERIGRAIEKARAEGRPHGRGRGRAVVIGGGHLGVEVAAALHREGLAVDLAVKNDWPWDKFAGESVGKFVALYLQKAGIAVHLNSPAARIEGDGRVQRVVLSPGAVLPCDFAVAAVGPVANKDLLRGSAVTAGKAILVDDHCRTNVPVVFAAGDCAAIFDPLFGKYRVLAHADDAVTTGTIAGQNMAGADEAYRTVTHFWSEVKPAGGGEGLTLHGWGEARHVDRRLLRGTPKVESPDFAEIGLAADGRVALVLAIGRGNEHEQLRELVGRRFKVDGNQEQLKDPAAGLGELFNP